MTNPRTMRTLLLPGLVITAVLFAASVLVPFLPDGMAVEPGGLSPAGVPQPKGQVFYISPEGNDAWSGQPAEPNPGKTDGPFATIAHARDAIRSMQAHGPLTQPVTVYLRAGDYSLSAPLVFLPGDSGTADCPITYARRGRGPAHSRSVRGSGDAGCTESADAGRTARSGPPCSSRTVHGTRTNPRSHRSLLQPPTL